MITILIIVLFSASLYIGFLFLIKKYQFIFYIYPLLMAIIFEITDSLFWEEADSFIQLTDIKESPENFGWYNTPNLLLWWAVFTLVYEVLPHIIKRQLIREKHSDVMSKTGRKFNFDGETYEETTLARSSDANEKINKLPTFHNKMIIAIIVFDLLIPLIYG